MLNGKNEEETPVKVAVRVRPLVEREKISNERSCVRLVLATNQLIIGRDKTFAFDNVFAPRSTQAEVYDTCVSPLVSGFIEGYNSTVFAYGQTGSGKTHTVTGHVLDPNEDDHFGIVPRAISAFFRHLKIKNGRSCMVKVSYIEIYKEELHDLLRPETSSKDLHIREDDSGNTLIMGAEEVLCENDADVLSCLRRGSAVRHTGATGMNDVSSRSHAVFTITLEQTWMSELEVQQNIVDAVEGNQSNAMHHIIRSKFHFVDLAGSERAARTKNVGDRFKESVHINSGLLALGNVISALSDPRRRSAHVPYRDSKITRLLKDSLGGNAKTLMICCIGPADSDMDESLNSLNYASRARNIKNKPVINQDAQTRKFEAMKSEIMTLRDELNRQRTLMTNMAAAGEVSASTEDQTDRLRELEDKIGSLHGMCAQYRVASEEAYRQLIALDQAQLLSTSQNSRFKSWLGIIEHLRSSTLPTEHIDEMFSETIKKLEEELKRAKDELKSDEQIFADRAKQIRLLETNAHSAAVERDRLAVEVAKNAGEVARLQQMLISKEIEVTELKEKQSHNTLVSRSVDVGASLMFHQQTIETTDGTSGMDAHSDASIYPRLRPSTMLPVSNQRPRSVPALEKQYGSRPISRHVHTSPAFVSADKVMQSFRARSAMLQSRLEDSDSVLVKSADRSTSSTDEDDEDVTPNAIMHQESISAKVDGKDGKYYHRRGTYRLHEGRKIAAHLAAGQAVASPSPQDKQQSTKARALAESRDRASKLNDQLGDLQAQIRLKEQLIAQLVRSGRETDRVAQEQAEIIRALQREKEHTASELREVQIVLERMEADRSNSNEAIRFDYEQKLEAARKKVTVLKKKQAEADQKASAASKLDDLKITLGNLKQQQANLQKRLKEEMDTKVKLEREVEKDQVKIRQLEERSQQQERMLRQRADQLASARRRSGRPGAAHNHNESASGSENETHHRQWLEAEVEKVTAAREKLRQLEQQLSGQEELLAKREAMIGEREKLILRKMRSSQALTNELSALNDNSSNLQTGRAQLDAQRKLLTDRLASGMVLSATEERRLAELEEAIDAVDQALDYRQEALGEAQSKTSAETVRQSTADVHDQLRTLHGEEARQLLTHLFDRIIELRDADSSNRLQIAQLASQLHERERIVRTLESALQESKVVNTARVSVDERAQRLSREINRDFQMARKATNDLRNRIAAAAGLQQQQEQQQQEAAATNKSSEQQENVNKSGAPKVCISVASTLHNSSAGGGFLGTAAQPDSPTSKASFLRGSEVTLISARRTPHMPPFEVPAAAAAATPSVNTAEPLQPSTTVILDPNASGSNSASINLTPVRVSRRGLRELSPSTIEARKRQQHQHQQNSTTANGAGSSFTVADSLEALSAAKRN